MQISCEVYRSARHDNMYLYVRAEDGMSRVPEALLVHFGEAVPALTFELTPQRKLAKEDPKLVISNLQEHGYHLQLPPLSNWHPENA